MADVFVVKIPRHLDLQSIDVYFGGVSNLAVMEQGWRIVDLKIAEADKP